MSTVLDRVMDMLRQEAIPFELIHHRTDYTAQETAQDTHTPGRRFIKTVVVRVDDDLVLALLPAPRMVNVEALQRALGASRARLASEAEMAERFPECEVGALPPFGSLFGVPVYSDLHLNDDEQVTFTAGTHRDAIRVRYGDLRRLVGATPLAFAE
ncbi:MAG: YbaK/EbsC family protein [Chloroflexaceae bacterium]